jgi:hypothetical protein
MKQAVGALTGVLTQALITTDAGMFSVREVFMRALTLAYVHALMAMVAKLRVSDCRERKSNQ